MRVHYNPSALQTLNDAFDKDNQPCRQELKKIAESIGYDLAPVRLWFQNRRAKQKRETRTSSRCNSAEDGNMHMVNDRDLTAVCQNERSISGERKRRRMGWGKLKQ